MFWFFAQKRAGAKTRKKGILFAQKQEILVLKKVKTETTKKTYRSVCFAVSMVKHLP